MKDNTPTMPKHTAEYYKSRYQKYIAKVNEYERNGRLVNRIDITDFKYFVDQTQLEAKLDGKRINNIAEYLAKESLDMTTDELRRIYKQSKHNPMFEAIGDTSRFATYKDFERFISAMEIRHVALWSKGFDDLVIYDDDDDRTKARKTAELAIRHAKYNEVMLGRGEELGDRDTEILQAKDEEEILKVLAKYSKKKKNNE